MRLALAAVLALVIDGGFGWCECEAAAKLLYPLLPAAAAVVVAVEAGEIVFVPARWYLVLVTIRHCPSALAAFLFLVVVLMALVNSGVVLVVTAAVIAVVLEGQEAARKKAQEGEDAEE